jgi:hypothetical protein
MEQFTVPQFIDVEDKVFGPITTRQFIILLVASGLTFLFWKLFDFALFLSISIPMDGFALLMSFMKVRGQFFHIFLLNFIQTFKKPKMRMWHKSYSKQELREWSQYHPKKVEVKKVEKAVVKRSRLAQLSLVVNTGGSYKPGDND